MDTEKQNALEEKIKKSTTGSGRRKPNFRIIAIVLIALLIVGGMGYGIHNLFANREPIVNEPIQDTVIKEEPSETQPQLGLKQDPEVDARPESLKKDYRVSLEGDVKEESSGDYATEFKQLPDNLKGELVNYYEEIVLLDVTVDGSFYSEKNGYTSDKSQKGDGPLPNEWWIPVTSEEMQVFLAHEIEKALNPSYSGNTDEEASRVSYVNIEETDHVKYVDGEIDLEEYKIEYNVTVGYYAHNSETEETLTMSFIVDNDGKIQWLQKP